MDYVQIVNLNELLAFNEHLMDRIDEQHRVKALRWLNRNVKNSIVSAAKARIDSWFTPEGHDGSADDHSTGITFYQFFTPKDVRSGPMPVRRIDLYALDHSIREAYVMGCALIGVESWEEYGNNAVHLCEALSAMKGGMANWDSITVTSAEAMAKLWVDKLKARHVEGGGCVTEVGTYEGFMLVKLEDEAAYISEGKIMDHCVADLWGKSSLIYSLRKEDKRFATIEVQPKSKNIIQVRGVTNSDPYAHETEGPNIAKAMAACSLAMGWRSRVLDATQLGLGIAPDLLRQYPVATERELMLGVDGNERPTLLGTQRYARDNTFPIRVPEVAFLDRDEVEICSYPQLLATVSVTGNMMVFKATGAELGRQVMIPPNVAFVKLTDKEIILPANYRRYVGMPCSVVNMTLSEARRLFDAIMGVPEDVRLATLDKVVYSRVILQSGNGRDLLMGRLPMTFTEVGGHVVMNIPTSAYDGYTLVESAIVEGYRLQRTASRDPTNVMTFIVPRVVFHSFMRKGIFIS